ncbi:MAG TPA: glucose-6-phosphate dehydrogenase [Candidatus Hydrogenedentes bacterium]|nr:glucose-6-phosphate dehydrogenase [Candidatus Hydrogenedentota bacterium]HOS03224.1 glucose-6-phosphate dehydrogenase [Candidatus Hydrogenedentota bacterium]
MSFISTTALQQPSPSPGDSRYRIAADAMATIVIFGVTGDLAGRKLIPAVYNLWRAGFLPERIAVVGVARKQKTDAEFRAEMCEALKKYSRTGHGESDTCDPFVANLHYHSLEFSADAAEYRKLGERLSAMEQRAGFAGSRLFYLATSPEFFAPVTERLGAAGMLDDRPEGPWARVVVEKPFGEDAASAEALNRSLRAVLSERQIYRIDHYLGKETVQNIFAFRLGNAIFEPLFHHHYVDHVQITVAETVGMEGRRGAFYDQTGALRDVVQNHALQLLCLVAMEPPARFAAQDIRDEKLKVLSSVALPFGDPLETWCVRGQYAEGGGMPGYVAEQGVAPDSKTETYVALRLYVDNWRWAGVPFYLRTGKRMASRVTEIALQFRRPPTQCFKDLGVNLPQPNVLSFRIQPDEAISLTFSAKPPGMEFLLEPVAMDFRYGTAFEQDLPEAYERLLLDALRGDSTLFMRADEIERAWRIVTSVRDAWKDAPLPELYRPGTWGPPEADRLFAGCQGSWRAL